MTPARHHAEWLSLVESSGPFLSMPVLLRVFPQGLDLRDSTRAAALRENYEDWLERGRPLLHVHTAWIRHVLESLLEWPAEFIAEGQSIPAGLEASQPHFGETLRPDLVLRRPPGSTADGDSTPQLLVVTYPPTQDLEKPVAGKVWKSSPATRMTELLHATGVPLGLVTNGEHWMVVYAPRGETSGFASWYADLWMQEPVTLRAFHSLLGLRRFFGVAAGETLAALYAESAKDQQEVTDQLGRQVRRAVEMLVQAFDQIDAESNRTLLASVPEKEVYDAALTVMMRLVFLFSAEERGLLLLGDPLFDQHYAVSTLRELLRERADQHGEEVLERRHDAWSRLLATFRAVHGGVQHEAMRLPAYGGSLFDPDRYPFLEGREAGSRWRETAAHPLAVNNRVVLHLLEALQLLRVKVPGGGPAEARRVSFRALDIEQIGHVYEGLLDHTARRTAEPVLGLDGKKEPEIPLARLEELAGIVPSTAEITLSDERMVADSPGSSVVDFPTRRVNYGKAPAALIDFLKEETGRTPKALQRLLDAFVDDHTLLLACGQDPRLARRVRPFAGLLRSDDFGRLAVIRPGAVFVTEGTDRRSSGTHYTPRSLTEPIVKYTLDPLVYIGPAEGLPETEWKLKSPKEILALKVCDMAMGSGAFLVQVCRYLAERLCEAWELAERDHAGSILITPDGEFSSGAGGERLLPTEPAERIALARRFVADRCLYGVDINLMAVEMAKLSLWLITLQKDRPFTFLDHALKHGDSLLGVTSTKQIENFSLRAISGETVQETFATSNLFRYVEEAALKRRALEELPSHDHSQIETKNRLHAEAEASITKVKALADQLIALELRGLVGNLYEEQRAELAEKSLSLMQRDSESGVRTSNSDSHLARAARDSLQGRRTFHWPVEFPEVFDRGGFDGVVGNPPFLFGTLATTALGADYMSCLHRLFRPWHGKADFVGLFLRRIENLISPNGYLGLLATAALLRGETRESSLDVLCERGFSIFRARTPYQWPGTASVTAVSLWLTPAVYSGLRFIDDRIAQNIDPSLEDTQGDRRSPSYLISGASAFLGLKVCPANPPQPLKILQGMKSELVEFYVPIIGGDDLYRLKTAKTADLILDSDRILSLPSDVLKSLFGPSFKATKYAHSRPAKELRSRLEHAVMAVACAETSAGHLIFEAVPSKGLLFSHKTVVFPAKSTALLAVLQSSIHVAWAWKYGMRRGKSLNYSPKRCASTFVLPPMPILESLEQVANDYITTRRQIAQSRNVTLTGFYNLLHKPTDSEDITNARKLNIAMDQAVAASYGWQNLDLGHDFHETEQGRRFTISETARREVLDRLLALNHQRHAEEVATDLHEKRGKKSVSANRATKRGRKAKASAPEAGVPVLPADFRFPAPSPQLYAVNLVTALLSARPGGLAWRVLRDSFAAATQPALMRRLAFPQDRMQVAAWAGRWNEQATPDLLIPTLREMTGANIAVTGRGTDAVFALQDGPQEPATEDVAYDAWLALRVVEPLTSSALPDDEASVLDGEIENLLASL